MIFVEIGRYDHWYDSNEQGKRVTVKDVFNTLSEEQRKIVERYLGEITAGYLTEGTRKDYAKMALNTLNADQLKVVAFIEMKMLEGKGRGK